MADTTGLHEAIKDLTDEVRRLREDKPKKSLIEHVTAWAPLVMFLLAAATFMMTGNRLDTRIADLDKKVEAGFDKLRDGLTDIKVTLAKTSASQPPPVTTPPSP